MGALHAIVFVRGKMAFGKATERQVDADNGTYVEIIVTIEIAGGAQQHLSFNQNGHILITGSTVTLTGRPSPTLSRRAEYRPCFRLLQQLFRSGCGRALPRCGQWRHIRQWWPETVFRTMLRTW
jgi:hypothetical protein